MGWTVLLTVPALLLAGSASTVHGVGSAIATEGKQARDLATDAVRDEVAQHASKPTAEFPLYLDYTDEQYDAVENRLMLWHDPSEIDNLIEAYER